MASPPSFKELGIVDMLDCNGERQDESERYISTGRCRLEEDQYFVTLFVTRDLARTLTAATLTGRLVISWKRVLDK